MGFLPAIRRIVTAVPRTRQTMCYSATLDANIQEIVRDYVKNPIRIEIGSTSKPSDRVELRACMVMQDQKLGLLNQMLNEEQGTFLVFSRTKHGADRISRKLEKLGHDSNAIHGDRTQSQRTSALKGFATGKHRVLVATDVAARGIDISDIAHVVNYDLPNASEDFVHRIGRTGRAGAKGVATTFVMPQEKHEARKLERELKIRFDWREADKNLEREERNKPLDLTSLQNDGLNDLLALETRSWRSGEAPATNAAPSRNGNGNSNGFRKRRAGNGPSQHGRGNGGNAHPSRNASHPRGGNSGSRPSRGNRGR
jgi:ATP-dependent RNA helicase RhlE